MFVNSSLLMDSKRCKGIFSSRIIWNLVACYSKVKGWRWRKTKQKTVRQKRRSVGNFLLYFIARMFFLFYRINKTICNNTHTYLKGLRVHIWHFCALVMQISLEFLTGQRFRWRSWIRAQKQCWCTSWMYTEFCCRFHLEVNVFWQVWRRTSYIVNVTMFCGTWLLNGAWL